MDSLGIVAGSGTYPLLMARQARRQGVKTIIAVAFKGETDPEIELVADKVEWLRVGEMNRLIAAFTSRGVREVAMVGAVALKNLFDLRPDFRTLRVLLGLKQRNAATLFGAVVGEMEKDGLKVVEATRYLEHLLPAPGLIAGPRPKTRRIEDLRWGANIARQMAALDIGQCVVIKDRVVVAVEAVEGTDGAITRGGTLAKEGAVVVKRCKPQQDLRFDLPAIGPRTIEVMASVKAAVLAVEAGRTVMLDRDLLIRKAEDEGIAVVGVRDRVTESAIS
mgnify:CR=1 FL=1